MATISQTPEQYQDMKWVRFQVSESLWERLTIAKVKERITIEAICTQAITEFLDKHGEEDGGRAIKRDNPPPRGSLR